MPKLTNKHKHHDCANVLIQILDYICQISYSCYKRLVSNVRYVRRMDMLRRLYLSEGYWFQDPDQMVV